MNKGRKVCLEVLVILRTMMADRLQLVIWSLSGVVIYPFILRPLRGFLSEEFHRNGRKLFCGNDEHLVPL